LLVMELRQLRYFVAVADERHFARAAARLLIAAPSLSQQIKALERDLGVRLFERSSTGVSLTAAGSSLLPQARDLLEAAEELEHAARRIAEDREVVLRLGFLPFALTPTTRRLLTEFGRSEPRVTVQMRQYEWDDPSAGLLTSETAAALVRPPFRGDEGLHLLELAREQLFAITAEDSPLAGLESITVAQLAEETWIEASLLTDPVFARWWYLRDLRPDGRARTVHSAATTIEEWVAEVAFGRGVNLVPAGLTEEYRRPGVAFVPVADAPASVLALAWRRDAPPGPAEALARFASTRTRPGAPLADTP
jgi:DNA-binding transcriptional LysR family regulator